MRASHIFSLLLLFLFGCNPYGSGGEDSIDPRFGENNDDTSGTELEDVIAPTISSLSPADGATSLATSTDLTITFSENIQEGTGFIYIKKASDDSTLDAIDVTGVKVSVSATVATIDASTLSTDTEYYIQIDATAFRDTSSSANAFAGISDKSTWNFFTVTTADQTDDDNSVTGFGGGIHSGTAYGGGVLTLNATNNNADLDESWTPEWDNLVSYWKMDETSWNGTANEVIDSKGANHGMRAGDAATISSSKIGSYAGVFDGAGDYIDIGQVVYDPTGSDNFSACGWFYASSLSSNMSFLGKRDGGGFRFSLQGGTTGDPLRFSIFGIGNQNSASSNLKTNTWNHTCISYDLSNISFYLNGSLLSEHPQTSSFLTAGARTLFLGAFNSSGSPTNYFDGRLDDWAIWNTALEADEVALIYSRQSAKFAGQFESRIMDSRAIGSTWTNLDWSTTLPFYKELPDGGGASNSESSENYSSLSTDSLMNEIGGLWHLNGMMGIIADDAVIPDASGNGNDGVAKDSNGTNTIAHVSGKFAQGISLDGSNDRVEIAAYDYLGNSDDLTLSMWINPSASQASYATVVDHDHATNTSGSYGNWALMQNNNNINSYYFAFTNNGVGFDGTAKTTQLQSNVWQHFVIRKSGTDLDHFLNGEKVGSTLTVEMSIEADSRRLFLGGTVAALNRPFSGALDEVGIWKRPLSDDEILQLFRRGANRIKFQVRSCASADCSDQDTVAPGHGWQGPGGNYLSYFSELYNNTSVSSNCDTAQSCFTSELSLDGDVQTNLPSLFFSDFGSDGIYLNDNRYFQYRVVLESDDENTACNGGTQTCMPELESVEIGPAHTY